MVRREFVAFLRTNLTHFFNNREKTLVKTAVPYLERAESFCMCHKNMRLEKLSKNSSLLVFASNSCFLTLLSGAHFCIMNSASLNSVV